MVGSASLAERMEQQHHADARCGESEPLPPITPEVSMRGCLNLVRLLIGWNCCHAEVSNWSFRCRLRPHVVGSVLNGFKKGVREGRMGGQTQVGY